MNEKLNGCWINITTTGAFRVMKQTYSHIFTTLNDVVLGQKSINRKKGQMFWDKTL